MSVGNLILTRKPGEHLAIAAPRNLPVLRQELKPVSDAVKRRLGL